MLVVVLGERSRMCVMDLNNIGLITVERASGHNRKANQECLEV
jgi:hypothetical protein